MGLRAALVLAIVACSSVVAAHADTLASSTTGVNTNIVGGYTGQSFTVVGNGSYSDISFNLYTSALTPYAVGTGFLFSSSYSGTPSGLTASSPAKLAAVSAANGFYDFGDSVDLLANQTYYFYENALIPSGEVSGNSDYSDNAFFTLSANEAYSETTSANFNVTGTSVTPEPSSLALIATGALGVIGAARRRFAA